MESAYSKFTIAQLRTKLAEKGIEMPSKSKKNTICQQVDGGRAKERGYQFGYVL